MALAILLVVAAGPRPSASRLPRPPRARRQRRRRPPRREPPGAERRTATLTLPVEDRVDRPARPDDDRREDRPDDPLEKGSVDPAGVPKLLLGSVLSGGDGPAGERPGRLVRDGRRLSAAALGDPTRHPDAVWRRRGPRQNNVVGATIFPHQVGLGAANDAALVERIGRATAVEMAATGIRWDFGPVVAVPQDVRWGRTYEGYGEDPLLVSDLASAFIRGIQGDDLTATDAAAATAKHYVGDGGTAWGTSTTPGTASTRA